MNRLPIEKRVQILGCLTEGMSLRATTRLCDVSINTVTKLLVDVGAACDLYQNEKLATLGFSALRQSAHCFGHCRNARRFPASQ